MLSTRGGPWRSLALLGCLCVVAPACAVHPAVARRGDAPSEPKRPELIRPMRGLYVVRRAGERVGEERFTITSSRGTWRAAGEVNLSWPVEQRQGYVLEVDARRLEPVAFRVWVEIEGERQESRGRLRDDVFEIQTHNIAGEYTRTVAYGQGTVIDFGSPLFNTLPLSLLDTYELRGEEGGLRKIAVAASRGRPSPIAMWVRADGLPERVRTWDDQGVEVELRLAN